MNNRLKSYAVAFYVIVAVGFVFIFFTNPFLIKLYDPFRYHLATINEFYQGIIGRDRLGHDMWHFVWANVFKLLGINDIFIWAKIIHVFQFVLAAVIMYYFSKTVLTILTKSPRGRLQDAEFVIPACPVAPGDSPRRESFSHEEGDSSSGNYKVSVLGDYNNNELKKIQIKFLSLLAVVLWFIGNGTFSVHHQQAWIMWYSVTYQGLTIPLFWYSTALTLKLFYKEFSFKKNLLFLIQIAIVSITIAKFHPMELLYYLINLPLIILINMKRIMSYKNKKVILISIPIICLILFVTVKYFAGRQPAFYTLISSNESAGQVIQKITSSGRVIVKTLNRFPNSFSELAQISLILAVIFRIFYLLSKGKKISFNTNLFDCMLLLSIISFLIPLVPLLAGLAGYITIPELVYRFFYVPPWFIFMPFFLYVFVHHKFFAKISHVLSNHTVYRVIKEKEIEVSKRKLFIDISAAGIVLFMLFAALYKDVFSTRTTILKQLALKTTSLNTQSIINSFDKKKVGQQ